MPRNKIVNVPAITPRNNNPKSPGTTPTKRGGVAKVSFKTKKQEKQKWKKTKT